MKKIFLAMAAAVFGTAILAGGIAQADGDKRGRDGRRHLATGFTFCPAGDSAVFPATNVSRRKVRVMVSCVDSEGVQFDKLGGDPGPARGIIRRGEAAILLKEECVDFEGLGGELVRCSIMGGGGSLAAMRGVLHICDTDIDGDGKCDLTEALLFGTYDDDDD